LELKGLEEELSPVDDWFRKNNLIFFGLEEYPHEIYFDTPKISEIFNKNKSENRHRGLSCGQCEQTWMKKGLSTDLDKVRFILKEIRNVERN
jgi:hypothetical protein